MPERLGRGREQCRHISYSTWREKEVIKKAACSAVFWGAMLVFSLLRGRSDVYVWLKQSLHTGFLWGALLPWLEAEPWENDSRRRVTADDNDNINIWEWERHPGKKVKAVCSREQLRGAHCGTVKQTNKRGNRLQTTLQSSQVISDLIQEISDSDFSATLHIIFTLQLAKVQILNLDKCPIMVESLPLWFKDLFQWAIASRD